MHADPRGFAAFGDCSLRTSGRFPALRGDFGAFGAFMDTLFKDLCSRLHQMVFFRLMVRKSCKSAQGCRVLAWSICIFSLWSENRPCILGTFLKDPGTFAHFLHFGAKNGTWFRHEHTYQDSMLSLTPNEAFPFKML